MFQALMLFLISVGGMFGNSVMITKFFLLKNEDKLNFHRIMILLSMYDNVLILMSLLLFVAPTLSELYKFGVFNYIAPVALPIGEIAITGSIYSTIAITVERFLVVCCPFYAVSHRWSAKRYILPIVIFSLVYNIPIFFEIKTGVLNCTQPQTTPIASFNHTNSENLSKFSEVIGETVNLSKTCIKELSERSIHSYDCGNTTDCVFQKYLPTDIRQDYTYFTFYHIILDLIFKCLIPFMTLIILNTMMIKRLVEHHSESKVVQNLGLENKNVSSTLITGEDKKRKTSFLNKFSKAPNSREKFLARVNLIIVFFFILCHSIRWVPHFYEILFGLDDWPVWITNVNYINHFAILLTSSINCCIYYNLPSRIIFAHSRKCPVNYIT